LVRGREGGREEGRREGGREGGMREGTGSTVVMTTTTAVCECWKNGREGERAGSTIGLRGQGAGT